MPIDILFIHSAGSQSGGQGSSPFVEHLCDGLGSDCKIWKFENGSLKVIPNSHAHGILSAEKINEVVASSEIYNCEAQKGSASIMRPHLLHASSKSELPNNRWILHFEFSDWKLPDGISWSYS